MKRVPILGLFAGAGGLDLGAALAGGDVRLSLDNDPLCCQTLRDNPSLHTGRVEQKDLTAVTGQHLRARAGLAATEPCVVIGGPPCQPFSKAAYWTDPGDDSRFRQARARGEMAGPRPAPILEARPDERRDLLFHYWRLILETKAIGFVFENVPSIKHPRNRPAFERLCDDAVAAGYHILPLDVNAVDCGVAQRRQRAVLLGLKGASPPPPTLTSRSVTAGEALAPFAGAEYFEREEVVKGTWESQLREVPPGMNYKALTAWAGHPNPTFVAETRYWHFLLKLSPDLPSWTIPANPGPWVGPFHWDSRRLRTAELAALQGFPAGYRFAGNRRDRVRQIGNAVPPPLARHVLEPMLALLATGSYRPPAQALVS